jgi:hypothetical protein
LAIGVASVSVDWEASTVTANGTEPPIGVTASTMAGGRSAGEGEALACGWPLGSPPGGRLAGDAEGVAGLMAVRGNSAGPGTAGAAEGVGVGVVVGMGVKFDSTTNDPTAVPVRGGNLNVDVSRPNTSITAQMVNAPTPISNVMPFRIASR